MLFNSRILKLFTYPQHNMSYTPKYQTNNTTYTHCKHWPM
jgi:hypothetical protein